MGVYFISDLHLGHKNILEFSPNRKGITVDEHDEYILNAICSVMTKRDILYILGDVAFERSKLELLRLIPGTLKLIIGNHDTFGIETYQKYFKEIHGFIKYKEFWLSHAPIHNSELRGKKNIHGHIHHNIINDYNYVNVCVEQLYEQKPISLEQIRASTQKLEKEVTIKAFLSRMTDLDD